MTIDNVEKAYEQTTLELRDFIGREKYFVTVSGNLCFREGQLVEESGRSYKVTRIKSVITNPRKERNQTKVDHRYSLRETLLSAWTTYG